MKKETGRVVEIERMMARMKEKERQKKKEKK